MIERAYLQRLYFALASAIATAIVASLTVHSQVPVPRVVMQRLAKQLRNDIPSIRDCQSKSEFSFRARVIDLNGDKEPEYLLTSVNECECGQVNCSQWVYRAHDQSFDLLLEAEGYVLTTGSSSHSGYLDLKTTSRGSAVIVDHVSYAFNGRRYERSSSTIENLDTHETKPTEQPIRFARGMSSATVRGSAALAFPDSWTFDAKRGQMLMLDLQRVGGASATFTLIGPGTDGQRLLADSQVKWRDRLPLDGRYTILVDAKGDARARYALTVNIQ